MPHISPRLTWSILLPSLFAISQLAYGDSTTISVSDPRPIAKAVELLETIYGLPITYEDPPYVHETEVADVNLQRVPKWRTISLTYDMLSSTDASPGGGLRYPVAKIKAAVARAISSVLYENAASHGAGMFALGDDELFHVVPTHFINAKGEAQHLTPLLDTKVTILPKQRTGADLVSEICGSLSRTTGRTVVVGTTPSLRLRGHATTITDSGATARSLLTRLLVEMDVPLSWQLFYDPGLQWYALNIREVSSANR